MIFGNSVEESLIYKEVIERTAMLLGGRHARVHQGSVDIDGMAS